MINIRSIAQARKAVVAAAGATVTLATSALTEFSSFIPDTAAHWTTVGVAFVTAVSVYLVKNAEVIDNVGNGISG